MSDKSTIGSVAVTPKESFGPTNYGKLSLKEIASNKLTQLSLEYWAPSTEKSHKPYDPKIIEDIYSEELKDQHVGKKKVVLLELSNYLERYLKTINFYFQYSNNNFVKHRPFTFGFFCNFFKYSISLL